jgi:CRISPR-associated protein Cst2
MKGVASEQTQMELLPDEEIETEATPGDQIEPATEAERAVTSQMLFSRPTRSGVYAFVTVFQPWRIGLNTVDYTYPKEIDRLGRYQLALRAYEAMFLRTDGAMTSTRLPHLEGFEGALVVSRSNFPAPVVSPLKEGYRDELEKLAQASSAGFDITPFDDLSNFVTVLRGLENDAPYTLQMPRLEEGANG